MTCVLDALRALATRRADAVALRARDGSVGYGELHDAAERLSRLLAGEGVRVLALVADNSPGWIVADLAARMAGIAVVPVPLFFSGEQVRHALADSGADAALADAAGARALADLDPDASLTPMPGWRLTRIGPRRRPRALPAGTAKISYTSGTTGRPKGVCLTAALMDRVAASLCDATAELAIARHLCLMPLATLLENVAGVYAPLLSGAEIAVPGLADCGVGAAGRIDAERMLGCIGRYRAESVIVVPQMLAALVAAVEAGLPRPETLEFIAVGGGCVAASLLERADRLALPVYEGYGLTECASVVALNSPSARRPGSVGRPLAHVGVRIGPNGEVVVAGAAMLGYLGEPSVARDEIATGDLGHLDADGYLYLDGRRRNVFITSYGRNVSPDWVEAALAARPAIAQAALFGEAQPWNVAVVVPAGASVSDADIERDVEAVNARLPEYARAHRWIRAREPFTPANGLATANGRNRRDRILARYHREIEAGYADSVARSA